MNNELTDDELADISNFYMEGILDFNTNVSEHTAIPIINEVFYILGIASIKRLSSINKRNNEYTRIIYKKIHNRISITFHIISTHTTAYEILDIKDVIIEYSNLIYDFDIHLYIISEEPVLSLNKDSILVEYAMKDDENTRMLLEGVKACIKKAMKNEKKYKTKTK